MAQLQRVYLTKHIPLPDHRKSLGGNLFLSVKFLSSPLTVHSKLQLVASVCPYSYMFVAYFISIVDITTAHYQTTAAVFASFYVYYRNAQCSGNWCHYQKCKRLREALQSTAEHRTCRGWKCHGKPCINMFCSLWHMNAGMLTM